MRLCFFVPRGAGQWLAPCKAVPRRLDLIYRRPQASNLSSLPMTLVVARTKGQRVSLVADTLILENGSPLPLANGMVKTCSFPSGVCVGFAGSPELARLDLWRFSKLHPQGVAFGDAVSYFEESSRRTENEYLLAFADTAKIAKIAKGKRQPAISTTQWIGDKDAYEAFREHEAKARRSPEHPHAFSAVAVWNEPDASPTSDLYSTMRRVVYDGSVRSVGGLVTAISNIDGGFRPPSITDVLYNWPATLPPDDQLNYELKVGLTVDGENVGQSSNLFGTPYKGLNLYGFYFLAGRLVLVFYPTTTLLADKLLILRNVEPNDIATELQKHFDADLGWQILIASAENASSDSLQTDHSRSNDGMRFSFQVHCNTFPPSGVQVPRPDVVVNIPGPNSEDV